MIFPLDALLAQAAALPQSTGHPALDTVLYLLSGMLGLLGLREGTYWAGKLRARRSGRDLEDKLDELAENQREHVHATSDVARALGDVAKEIQAIRLKLAEIQGRLEAP